MLNRRSCLGGLATLSAAGLLRPAPARAATWPDRPVTWVVPAAAGGLNDTFARPIAQQVAESFGEQVVIDNRTGAGGSIGAALVARAAPDGYTMLVAPTNLVYLQQVYPNAGFDFARDFAPVSALARIRLCLVVSTERLKVTTLQEFIDLAKREPDSIEIGSSGIGSVQHLATEMLQSRTGIVLRHVPYRGTPQLLQDVLSGQVAAMWTSAGAIDGFLKDGKVRVLAVAGRTRDPVLPDVPTTFEAGLNNFRAVFWFGLFAPRRTPEPILDRTHAAVQKALADPEIKALWRAEGARVDLESRAEFAKFVARDSMRWNTVASAANIRLE